MGALLASESVDEEGGIVLLGEEFKGRWIFEGVDAIFLGEFDGERALEGVEVCEGELDDLASLFTAKDEACLCVFDELGSFLLDCTLGASSFGGAVLISIQR